jgi:hypothetical protein
MVPGCQLVENAVCPENAKSAADQAADHCKKERKNEKEET